MNEKDFSWRIRKMRVEREMSQRDLAELLGVDRTTVAGWETHRRTPDLFMIVKMADIFGVTIDNLVGRRE